MARWYCVMCDEFHVQEKNTCFWCECEVQDTFTNEPSIPELLEKYGVIQNFIEQDTKLFEI